MSSDTLSALEDFLRPYAAHNPGDETRYFSGSQLYVAFRDYLSRRRPNHIVSMDFNVFNLQLQKVSEDIKMETKKKDKSTFYEIHANMNAQRDEATRPEVNDTECVPSDVQYIKVAELNGFLCCKLCCGYLVEATTITECLHSFCKSCILKHFLLHNFCPVCGIVVHSTNPVCNLKADVVLQDIVNKILPGVEECELTQFMEYLKKVENKEESPPAPLTSFKSTVIFLEWIGPEHCTIPAQDLANKNIRIPDHTTVAHISKFVLTKLEKLGSIPSLNGIGCDILCGGVVLPAVFTIAIMKENGLDFEYKRSALHLLFNITKQGT